MAELLNLPKIYIDNIKYSGYNNNFIFKPTIFHNIYLKANVSRKIKMNKFSNILKGLALDYYYSNISINAIVINFN